MHENTITDLSQSKEAAIRPSTENCNSLAQDFLAHFYSFFGFCEHPFNNTPDPSFFYLSHLHREALMQLLFGVEHRRGFIVMTGEIGSGKTTLCRQFLSQLSPNVKTAAILNPKISAGHLLSLIAQDFGIPCKQKSKRAIYDSLTKFLLEGVEKQQNACILIDEAQCLSVNVLEEIRLISNLETPKQKLIQVILVGQPEFKDQLMRKGLIQLRQRINIYVHLKGLSEVDTKAYVRHRIQQVSGSEAPVLFEEAALEKVHEQTRGIPRLINTLCDRALMAAFTHQKKQINRDFIEEAIADTAFICQ